ncbi:MAG TPA: flap endonuclease-1 [Thermoplasmata archaeon]|nr:flap endonuclease-1 [Thermoplasmata archaeon]
MAALFDGLGGRRRKEITREIGSGARMGVNLTPIVIRHETTLEGLRGRSIAIDGNLELYQFLSVMRLRDGSPLQDATGRITSHLNGLVFRTTRLVADYDIRPVFVFDGPPPELKRAEIEKRRAAREKSQRAYEAALAAGDRATAWSKAVMTSRLTREMVGEAKTLLTYLGIPWVQAPSEGEAQAAFLARRGNVWAAGSKDYDSLLFGAPRLVRFLAIRGREFLPSRGRSRDVPPEVLDLDENLTTLGLTREQLIDAAILVGTDFNEGVKGIGPKTAVKQIREWGSLDGAPAEVRGRLPENLDAIRKLFLDPPVAEAVDLEPRPVREADALRFLCEERRFSQSRVESALRRLRQGTAGTRRLDEFV